MIRRSEGCVARAPQHPPRATGQTFAALPFIYGAVNLWQETPSTLLGI